MAIVLEQPDHAAAIETLVDRAFGPDRVKKAVYRLREGVAPVDELCFVSIDHDGRVDGTIRFWPIAIGTDEPALLLGPIAVAPERRSAGLGASLIRHGLAEAAARDHRAVVLVGDEPYYGRFGFSARLTTRLALPGPFEPARFLGLELVPGALAGACGRVGRGWPSRRTADRATPASDSAAGAFDGFGAFGFAVAPEGV